MKNMRASCQIMVNSEMMTKATGVVSKLQQRFETTHFQLEESFCFTIWKEKTDLLSALKNFCHFSILYS